MKLKIKRLDHFPKDGALPSYKSEGAAGLDVRFYPKDKEEISIAAGDTVILETGIIVVCERGYEIQVRSRSGLACHGIVVANSPGTIDSDYRGELKVIINNSSLKDFKLKPGNRFAQLVVSKLPEVEVVEVGEIDETERGDNGFGSTGMG